MKFLPLFFIVSLLFFSKAVANHELSEKIDLPQTGWNKVLQASNGNTLLFHFEARKPVIVKIFGTDRKEIASERYVGKMIEMNALERSELHGIFEIGGEAVIFISQAITNIETLVAVRFDTKTGKLIGEQKLIESPSFKRRIKFSVARNTNSNGYGVFCMKDLEANFEEKLHLEIFDDQHNKKREVPVSINTKEYDKIKHVSTCIGKSGEILVMLDCIKIVRYPNENDHFIAVCYLPEGDSVFSNVITKLPSDVGPYYGMYTYNDFGKSLNVFLVNATNVTYKNGLQTLEEVIYSPFMLMYKKDNLADMKFSPIFHAMANKQLKEATDTTRFIDPVPVKAYTNNFGMNTLISEENKYNVAFNNGERVHTFIGSTVVTQINDDGTEIWTTVLPKKQFLKEGPTPAQISKRDTHSELFRRVDPFSDWLYQFASATSIMTPKGTCYVIYNDLPSNFNNTLADSSQAVSNYKGDNHLLNTSAIYYKVTKKREVTKQYLLPDTATLTKCPVMTESGDYNVQTNTYASMFVQTEAGKPAIKLGWVKFDD